MKDRNNKVFDFVGHEVVVDKIVKREFTRAFMSNAKWRKLFVALDEATPQGAQVIWKFVGAKNDGVRHSLPPSPSLGERYLDDRFWFGPCYYKEIEWIEFPRVNKPYGREKIPGAHFDQDVEAIKSTLESIGAWELEATAIGYRVYGYKP